MWGSRSLPVIKLQFITFTYKMVNASPADAAILEPTDDLHEDPFVLPDVLGYLRMPDMARWAVPNNLSRREIGDSSSKAAINKQNKERQTHTQKKTVECKLQLKDEEQQKQREEWKER